MEYRSPLGYNFKLEESLSTSKNEETKETPHKDDSFSLDSSSSSSKKFSDFGNRRNSGGGRNYSPSWQRHRNSWNSPSFKNSQQNEPVPIEQYYHPSMLENPWEELERNLKTS